MFEKLFTSSKAVDRYSNGSLLEDRVRYLAHCAAQGSTRSSLRLIAQHQLVLIDYLHLQRKRLVNHPSGESQTARCWKSGRTETCVF